MMMERFRWMSSRGRRIFFAGVVALFAGLTVAGAQSTSVLFNFEAGVDDWVAFGGGGGR